MAAFPPVIAPAPTVPQRGDKINFKVAAQDWNTWEKQAFPQIRDTALNTYNNANEAYQSAINAIAASNAAVSSVGISAFNPATTYNQYAPVFSTINLLPYRRRTAGISATDPANDATNWASGQPAVIVTNLAATATTLVSGVRYRANATASHTMPLAPAVGDLVYIRNTSEANTVTLFRNGSNFLGLADDFVLDGPVANVGFCFIYSGSGPGWEIA